MTHFAKLEPTSDSTKFTVSQVIVAEQDFIDTLPDKQYWIQTSYNTRGGIHYGQDGKPDNGVALRANYAGIGHIYDLANDVFYTSQPYPSWTISEPNWTWTPPTPYPTDNKQYIWDETTQTWNLI
jgi:hypothetical protein